MSAAAKPGSHEAGSHRPATPESATPEPETPGAAPPVQLGHAYEAALAHQAAQAHQNTGSDPLRLCVFATVALLTWLTGPVAVAAFAVLGLVGYVRARRAGLLRSRCALGDTRLVIAYLALLLTSALAAVGWHVVSLFH
jgi:hypothetical protein